MGRGHRRAATARSGEEVRTKNATQVRMSGPAPHMPVAGTDLAGPPARHASATVLPILALLSVTAAWGSTVFLIKELVANIPAPDFLAVRFAVATVVLLPF